MNNKDKMESYEIKSPFENLGVELRSEEFQEVLGGVPPWILRWGITVLAFIFIILLVGSAVIKYPDVLSAQVVLTGSTPPAVIVSHASGKLKELYVTDNQEVRIGTFLAVIDNPALTEDILFLKKLLTTIPYSEVTDLPPENLRLGSLQSAYSTFRTSLYEYMEYKRLSYYPQKIAMTKKRKIQLEEQYNSLLNQQQLTEKQLNLAYNKFQRDSILNMKGIISNEELEITQNAYLQSLLTFENIISALNNMQIQIGQQYESQLDIGHQDIEIKNDLQTRLQSQVSQLLTEIQTWEFNYVLKSPIEGKITFTNYWVINQNIVSGSEIFTIIPDSTIQMIGKAMLPVIRSGKVKSGQKVNIHLQNFPEHEYGILHGTVKHISLAPTQTGETVYYSVEIVLTDGLITTYKKKLPYMATMQGQADIITEDLTLLERLVLPIKKILTENM